MDTTYQEFGLTAEDGLDFPHRIDRDFDYIDQDAYTMAVADGLDPVDVGVWE